MGFVTKSPWTSGSSPSWLLKLLPHPYTCPFLFKTSTCSAPTLISTMSSRPCTGQGRFNLHSVSDNAVRSWMPQVSTCPLAVKKTDKFLPTPILTMSLPRSSSMICGVPKNYMCNQYNPPTNAQDLLNNKKSFSSINFYQFSKTDNLIISDQNIWQFVFLAKEKWFSTPENHPPKTN